MTDQYKNPLSKESRKIAYLVRYNKETPKTGIIYCIINVCTGKKYYGQTTSFRTNHGKLVKFGADGRFNEHILNAEKGSMQCPKLCNAIRKYGKDAFIVKRTLICDRNDLGDFETYYILKYQTHINGYNISTAAKHHMIIAPVLKKHVLQ